MDFRAHLAQSSVMPIGFGAPVGALRRRSSARVLITVSKLRASSRLQYSIPPGSPHIRMHAAFSLMIPPWRGPVIAAHLGCVATLGRDNDQASQGRTRGRCTDGPITYQEREENIFIACVP